MKKSAFFHAIAITMLGLGLSFPGQAQVAVSIDISRFPELRDSILLRTRDEVMAVYQNGVATIYQREVKTDFDGNVRGSLKKLISDNNPALSGYKLALQNPFRWTGPIFLPHGDTFYFTTTAATATPGNPRSWDFQSACWKIDLETNRVERLLGIGDPIIPTLLDNRYVSKGSEGKVDNFSPVYPSLNGEREFAALWLKFPPIPLSSNPFMYYGLFERKKDISGKVTFEEIVKLQSPLNGQQVNDAGIWLVPPNLTYGVGSIGGPNARLERVNLETKAKQVLLQNGQLFSGDILSYWYLHMDSSYNFHVIYKTSAGIWKLVQLMDGKSKLILSTEQPLGQWGRPSIIQSAGFGKDEGLISLAFGNWQPDLWRYEAEAVVLWDRQTDAVIPVLLLRTGERIVGGQHGSLGREDFLTIDKEQRLAGWYAVLRPSITEYPAIAESGSEVKIKGENLFIAGCATQLLVDGASSSFSKIPEGGISFKAPSAIGEHKVQVRVSYDDKVGLSNAVSIRVEPPVVPPPVISAATLVFVNALSPPKNAFAPYEVVTLWGKNMCESAAAAQRVLQLPTELAGCKVMVDNTPARLYYVSPIQINLQLPALSPGGHQLTVQNSRQVVSGPFQFRVEVVSPSFVTNPQNSVYLQRVDGSFVARENPARPGETLVVYGTGLGLTTPEVPYGGAGIVASVISPVKAVINGEDSEVAYAGTTWEFPGLYQINFTVPLDALPDELGLAWLEIRVGNTSTVFRFNLVP